VPATARLADRRAPNVRRTRLLSLVAASAVLVLGAGVARLGPIGGAVDGAARAALRAAAPTAGAVATAAFPVTPGEPRIQYRIHVVAPGDTLDALARRFGIAAATIAANNSLEPGSDLVAGEGLYIPSSDGLLYTVLERGLTARVLAARLGLREEELAPVLADRWGLAQGRTVLIPLTTARLSALRPALDAEARLDAAAAARLAALPNTEPVVSSPSLLWPASGRITQLIWSGHTGVDIAAPGGTPIWAPADGVVTFEGWTTFGGIAVCTEHADGLESCVYHAAATLVSVGDTVRRGQEIATVGMSGLATGPHVHWEVLRRGAYVNPLSQ